MDPSRRLFPILRPLPGHVARLPWAMLEPHALRALRTHDQSLDVLARRGGLSYEEALAVLEDRRWSPRPDAHLAVDRLVQAWYEAHAEEPAGAV